MSRYANRGRHRSPVPTGTAVRSAALSAGVVAAVMVGTAAQASAAPTDPWYRLRICESGGNYSINTGNGFYGAYQFDLRTWRSYGGSGRPSDASPAEQDRRAKLLYQARGWAPWPGCSRKLGLRNDPAYGAGTATGIASRSATRSAIRATTLSAPATLGQGSRMTLTGAATPGATVRIFLRHPKEPHYRLLRAVTANRAGHWATVTRPTATGHYYAVAGASRSATRTTKLVVPTTVSAPAVVTLGAAYTISGTARPGTKVLVRLGPVTRAGFSSAYRRPVNRAGKWSLVWKGTNDYRYYALGETRTAVRVTRVGTTATAVAPATARLAPGSRPVVTVAGSTRPNATLVLYVRTPGRSYAAYRKFTASGSGRYTHEFRAPTDAFSWYVRASNGLYSRIGKVSL